MSNQLSLMDQLKRLFVDWEEMKVTALKFFLGNKKSVRSVQLLLFESFNTNANYTLDEILKNEIQTSPFANNQKDNEYFRMCDTWAMKLLRLWLKKEEEAKYFQYFVEKGFLQHFEKMYFMDEIYKFGDLEFRKEEDLEDTGDQKSFRYEERESFGIFEIMYSDYEVLEMIGKCGYLLDRTRALNVLIGLAENKKFLNFVNNLTPKELLEIFGYCENVQEDDDDDVDDNKEDSNADYGDFLKRNLKEILELSPVIGTEIKKISQDLKKKLCLNPDWLLFFLNIDEKESHFSRYNLCKPDMMKEIITPSGMRSFGMAIERIMERTDIKNIYVTSQTYYEFLCRLKTINWKIKCKIVRRIKDINDDSDVIVTEFHMNDVLAEMQYSRSKNELLEKIEKSKTKMLILDTTLNTEPEIQKFLNKVRFLVDRGLEIILIRSLTKFDQLGWDRRSAGSMTIFCNKKVVFPQIDINSATVNYFNHFRKEGDKIDKYMKKIRENSKFVHKRLKRGIDSMETLTQNRMKVVPSSSGGSCYVAINCEGLMESHDYSFVRWIENFLRNYPVKHLIVPLCRELRVEISQRTSIGFRSSSINVVHNSIRLTIGIEEERVLGVLCDILIYTSFILNRLFLDISKSKDVFKNKDFWKEKCEIFLSLEIELDKHLKLKYQSRNEEWDVEIKNGKIFIENNENVRVNWCPIVNLPKYHLRMIMSCFSKVEGRRNINVIRNNLLNRYNIASYKTNLLKYRIIIKYVHQTLVVFLDPKYSSECNLKIKHFDEEINPERLSQSELFSYFVEGSKRVRRENGFICYEIVLPWNIVDGWHVISRDTLLFDGDGVIVVGRRDNDFSFHFKSRIWLDKTDSIYKRMWLGLVLMKMIKREDVEVMYDSYIFREFKIGYRKMHLDSLNSFPELVEKAWKRVNTKEFLEKFKIEDIKNFFDRGRVISNNRWYKSRGPFLSKLFLKKIWRKWVEL